MNYFFRIENRPSPWHWIPALTAIAMICVLVCLYPLCSDDYGYAFITGTDERVQSLWDIIVSQYRHYFLFHGRVWNHVVYQFLMMHDKIVFNVTLPFVYLFTCYLIAKQTRANTLRALSIIIPSFWILLPVPGQTIFWLGGASNYIFATCIALLFISLILSDNKWHHLAALPIAVLAGNSHEGTSCGLLVALLIFSVLDKERKKGWIYYTNLLLFTAGIIIFFLSPGSIARINSATGSDAIDTFPIKQIVTFFKGAFHLGECLVSFSFDHWLVIFIIFFSAVGNLIYYKQEKRINALAFSLFLGAIINFSLPLTANVFYSRAFYGASSLALISMYINFIPLLKDKTRAYNTFYIFAFCINIFTFICAIHQISTLRGKEHYIINALSKNESIICVPDDIAFPSGRFIEDYGNYPHHFYNKAKSHFYGYKQSYSVLCDPIQKSCIQHYDFKNPQTPRICRIPSLGVVVRLDKINVYETTSTSLAATQDNNSLKAKLRALVGMGKNMRDSIIPTASVSHNGKYYIIIPSTEKNIKLEIDYLDGEKEVININEEE